MAFEQAAQFESKSVTASDEANKLGTEALNLLFAQQAQKSSADKVAIGTCPDCNPPFEWPPNEPKPVEPKPKPADTKSQAG